MNHNEIVQTASIFCMAAFMAIASLIAPKINAQRDVNRVVIGTEMARALPPQMVVLTTALSVFRGIAVDILWYRANALKEDGKFAEANQLSEWITVPQLHFIQVWVFHAWNMAFNISVVTKTPEERWDWVNKGIILLRDRGIPLNPRSAELYKELNWIYYFKIGQYSDDMNMYYKARFAMEWEEVMGSQTEGLTSEQAYDQFKKIADAPDTLDGLIQSNPKVVPLLSRLKDAGFEPDERLCLEIGRIKMFLLNPTAMMLGYNLEKPISGVDPGVCAAMGDEKLAPAVEPLLAYLRKRVLIEHYHMDPAYMLELMKIYGPLDWRHPASHSCYWSSMGTRISEENEKRQGIKRDRDIDLLNTYRGSIHAMQELMFRGRLNFDPLVKPSRYDLTPDPRFIPSDDAALDLSEKYLDEIDPKSLMGTRNSFEDGHINFLQTAIQFAYVYGDSEQAQKYYDKLRRLYGAKKPGQFDKPLDDLIRDNLMANLDTMYNTRQFIDGMLIQALTKGLANNRPQLFDRFVKLAKMVYDKWNEKRETLAHQELYPTPGRQKFMTFDQVVTNTYVSYMSSASLSSPERFRIWIASPVKMQLSTFDRLVRPARDMAKTAGFDPIKAFPEPEGMADYRREHPSIAPPEYGTPTAGPVQTETK